MNVLEKIQARKRMRAARKKIEAYERMYRSEPKERPAAVPVEETFDQFVEGFGGRKISDLIQTKSKMPRNADYIFPQHNVIAELKTLEGIFAGEGGLDQLRQVFIDAGEPPTSLIGFVSGNKEMPDRVASMIRKRIRRGLEARVVEARKQLRRSKTMFGDKDTKTLILFAMDRDPIFGHRTTLFHLAGLMGSNYADEHTDGVVYMNPNMPTQLSSQGMEFTGWFPFYRDDAVNAELSGFVNLLGNRWLTHVGGLNGVTNPILELETFEDLSAALGGGS